MHDIVSLRNEIEHYYTGETASRLRELIADTFIIVRDFSTVHLAVSPLDLLGEETWQHLLTIGEVYQTEMQDCNAARADLDWPEQLRKFVEPHMRCPDCNSELLRPVEANDPTIFVTTFKCTSCNKDTEYAELAELAVDSRLGADAHVAIKDGGESPYAECPDCSKDAYLIEGDICAACGYERQYHACAVCDSPLSVEEEHLGGLCSYHAYQADKDD